MQVREGTELERSSRGGAGREPSLSVSSPFLLAQSCQTIMIALLAALLDYP